MSLGTVQINGQRLSTLEVEDICRGLQSDSVRCLSLRKCTTTDQLFEQLMNCIGSCKSILQLNLNLGLVKNFGRVKSLCRAVYDNRSLTSLFLHGSELHDKGMQILCKVLSVHPNIVSLDVGDCEIGDSSVPFLTELLPPNGAKRGLQELTLSGNDSITSNGWVQFFIALAASNTIRKLYLDYTNLREQGVNCLSVAIAASRSLQILDLEGAGVSENGAQTLLHLVKNYPVSLTDIVLSENSIKNTTKDAITLCLQENEAKRRMGHDSFVATAMENDYEDISHNSDLVSTTASTSTLNYCSESLNDSKTTDIYSSLESINSSVLSVQSSLQIVDDSDENAGFKENSVSTENNKKRKKVKNHSNKSETKKNLDHKFGFPTRILPQPALLKEDNLHMPMKVQHGKKEPNDSSECDSDDDMGTLLIGQTLPGYYAYPVRIARKYSENNRHVSPQSRSINTGGIHAQSASQMIYSD